MSRYLGIESCKVCPHRHYYSAGAYECLKYGTVLPASHILDIPEWCPLPKLPMPASAQETTSAPTEHAVHGGRIMTLRECMEAEETSPVQAVCDRAAHLADVSKRASCDGCGEDATDRCPHCQATTCGKCAVCEHSALNRGAGDV